MRLVKDRQEFNQFFGETLELIQQEREIIRKTESEYRGDSYRALMRFERDFQQALMDSDMSIDNLFLGPENSYYENGEEFKYRSIPFFREYLRHILKIIEESPTLSERFPAIEYYKLGIEEIEQGEHSIGKPKIHTIDEQKERSYKRLKQRKEKKIFTD